MEADLKWAKHNKDALSYANQGYWGLARNEYLCMAEQLNQEGRVKSALNTYLYVCVLDLSGASNSAAPQLRREFPIFDLRNSSLAPVVVCNVSGIISAHKIPLSLVKQMFMKRAINSYFPVPAERAWSILMLAINEKINLDDQPHCFEQIRELITSGGQGKVKTTTSLHTHPQTIWARIKSIFGITP